MKTIRLFCLGVLWSLCLPVGADTIPMAPKDTLMVVPIALDQASIDHCRSLKRYDYSIKESALEARWNELKELLRQWIKQRTRIDFTEEQVDGFLLIGVIVLFALIVLLLFIFKPKLFFRNKRNRPGFDLDEDIGSLNYPQLIATAIEQAAYAEAIRWKYLSTLNRLHERGLISYESNKTVNEYAYEIKDLTLRGLFRALSSQFIYYRYGNGRADRKIFEAFSEQSDHLINTLGE